jgi:hypothetical protein
MRACHDHPVNTKSLLPVVLVPSCILLIPLAAMLFKVEGWAWDAADFIVMWFLIAGSILAYKLVSRTSSSRAYRVAVGVAVVTGLLLIWINGAVGLIGSEDNPANLMYAGVLAIAAIGAGVARLKPAGMAWAMGATALAQFLVPVVALIIWRPDFGPGVIQVLGLNFFFVVLFAGSAQLFRHAAQTSGGAGMESTA